MLCIDYNVVDDTCGGSGMNVRPSDTPLSSRFLFLAISGVKYTVSLPLSTIYPDCFNLLRRHVRLRSEVTATLETGGQSQTKPEFFAPYNLPAPFRDESVVLGGGVSESVACGYADYRPH